MGQKLQTVGGPALPVCACVLLVFCSLASVPPVFVFRSCGCLLRCLAVLPLLLCPLACPLNFFTFDGHPVPRTGNIFGQSTGVLYLASRNCPKDGARKKCRSRMKIQWHVTNIGAPFACWMLPCSKQGEDIDEFPVSFFRSSTSSMLDAPVANREKETTGATTFRYLSVRRFLYVTYGAFCTFLVCLTFFISCIVRPVHMVVFELHSFPLKLSGNRKYRKQLFPDGKFMLFDTPNHESGTTCSTIWSNWTANPFSVMVPPALGLQKNCGSLLVSGPGPYTPPSSYAVS